ncbi:MAG: hypothetical protein OXG13_10645 [Gemmatimonadaceae bacterium]|nr:hypothetical protein [Gemmatimonadaceae bacterium]
MTDEFGKEGGGWGRRAMGGHLRVLQAESNDAGGYAGDNRGRLAICGPALA